MKAEDYMIPCMSKKFFGFECMGCGMQRGTLLLFRGEFSAAFHMFPAIYTTIPLFIFIALHFVDKRRSYTKIIIPFAILNAIIMVIAYFYKLTH